MTRLFAGLYAEVKRRDFDDSDTAYAIDYPAKEEDAQDLGRWTEHFEVHTPRRGELGFGMQEIYNSLVPRGLAVSSATFFGSSFKATLQTKIIAYRAQHGLGSS